MNLSEILAATRLELDDPDTGVDARDLLWSDGELVRFINEAQEEAARRAYLLFDDTSAVSQVAVDTTSNRFPVNARVIRVMDARLVGGAFRKLLNSNEDRLDQHSPTWGTTAGEPRRYVNRDKWILLDRIPLAVGVIQLETYILPTPLVLGTQEVLDIDTQHHEALLHWAKHRAYGKQDVQTLDPAKSAISSNKFTARFGRARAAAEEVAIRAGQTRRAHPSFF